MFYELLTGQLPFKASNEAEILFAIINNEPPRPSQVRDDMPELIEAVVSRMLEKNPVQRYPTCNELISDLVAIQSELETTSVVISRTFEPGRTHIYKRTRFIVSILSVIAIGVSVILVGVFSSKPDKDLVIAVLPFENQGSEEDEWFAAGITEEITSHLSRFYRAGLSVIGHVSAMHYAGRNMSPAEYGRELGADYILIGSVRWDKSSPSGNRVRINPQLIRVSDSSQFWVEEPYEGVVEDVFLLQIDVAERVVRALDIVILESERLDLQRKPTEDFEAYQLYLLGRYEWNKRTEMGLRKAIEYFFGAVSQDSSFASAYAGLADCYSLLPFYSSVIPYEFFPDAKSFALRAISIDSTLAEAHTSLAAIKYWYYWEWDGAEVEFQKAISLNPSYATAHHWYGYYLTAKGQFEDGILELRRAVELDPKSPIINSDLGVSLYHARQYDEAIAQFTKTSEIAPTFSNPHRYLGFLYLHSDMYDMAIEEFEKADYMPGLARVHSMLGNRNEAQQLLDQLIEKSKREYVIPLDFVQIYMGLGNTVKVFEWLEQAYRDHSPRLAAEIIQSPDFDPIRSDPQFRELINRIGLNGTKN